MKIEQDPYCLLGNGICPKDCRLYQYSQDITEALGKDFDPNLSRQTILLWDANHPDVNVVKVAAVVSSCKLESEKPLPTS